MGLYTVFIFFLIYGVYCSIGINYHNRIVGGSDAVAGQYPFAVSIWTQTLNAQFFCGGTILNPQWIITSGHCVNKGIEFNIQAGSNLLKGDDSNRVTLSANEYVVHPNFNPATSENDIGLIKLRLPLVYTMYIQPVYLPYQHINDTVSVSVIGWGQTSDSISTLSENLQHVKVITLSNSECRQFYGNQITNNMICVSGNHKEGICLGDSGSPLLEPYMYTMYYLIGVASFYSGNGCETFEPSGYTRVFPYTDWIKNIIANENNLR